MRTVKAESIRLEKLKRLDEEASKVLASSEPSFRELNQANKPRLSKPGHQPCARRGTVLKSAPSHFAGTITLRSPFEKPH